jgi:probable HAF family extracellular repeat protein
MVVGTSLTATGATHAALWNKNPTTIDLGTLGGTNSQANAINASGTVVGAADIKNGAGTHAALWNSTSITDLGSLGGALSYANAINASGIVVGWSSITGNAGEHATLWNGTAITDLNTFLDASSVNAGWVLRQALGINDSGAIVGLAANSKTGVTHAFKLVSAVPEPETYGMLLAGLGVMGAFARRRRVNSK